MEQLLQIRGLTIDVRLGLRIRALVQEAEQFE